MKYTILFLLFSLLLSCSQYKKLERKANKGDASSNKLLVELYSEEYSAGLMHMDNKISDKIIFWSKKGLQLKDADSTDKYIYLMQLGDFSNDKKEKYSYYKQAALYGCTEAQWIIGLYYLEGRKDVPKNDSAFYWINKAANDNVNAINMLGNIFSQGKILKADTLLGLYYYKKACACFGKSSILSACDSVIAYYKRNKNLKDTSELGIYSELGRNLRKNNGTR